MATLVYWVARRMDDSVCYSLRRRTRKEITEHLRQEGYKWRDAGKYGDQPAGYVYPGENFPSYAKPQRCVVKYRNALDLLTQCLTEGGAHWEEEE